MRQEKNPHLLQKLSKNKKKVDMLITIFSGYNPRAIITFIRTLVRNDIDFAIIAKSKDDDIFLTDYKNKVIAIREKKELDLEDIKHCLNNVKIKKESSELFIVPSTEALNRFLLNNRKEFENIGIKIGLTDKKTYETFSDKSKFVRLCKENSIKVPEEVDFTLSNIPLVAKPKKYANQFNEIFSPVLIFNQNDYFNFKKKYRQEDFFYQKLIEGHSFYLLYYVYKNKKIIKLSQENLIQQSHGKSIVAAISSNIHNDEISRAFESLLLTMEFFGLIMIEVRKQGNDYYMIEANPRFWGPSQLFFDAGINLFEHFLVDNKINVKITNTNELPLTKYFWNYGYNDVVFFDKKNFKYEDFIRHEIYNRPDTQRIYKKETIEKLKQEYSHISKHSNYQILAEDLQHLFKDDELVIQSRYEKQRLDYILKHTEIRNKTLIDIGANTGYFSFELLKRGLHNVVCYEGNKQHALFIQDSANLLELNDRIKVYNQYFDFRQTKQKYDIMLLLNVLHHIGDDYGDSKINVEQAKKTIINQLNNMSNMADTIIFQLGFNWKGDRKSCLFKAGLKEEMIEYIKDGVRNNWDIQSIGIAEKIHNKIIYNELNSENIKREDELGEFLNRPIFIMKVKGA